MNLQEIEEQLLAASTVGEQAHRQMPIQELDTAADASRIFELGEAPLERTEVDLEDVSFAMRDARGDTLFDVEKFVHRELTTTHVLGLDLHVVPTAHTRAHGQADERFVDHRLLRVTHDPRHLRLEKRGAHIRGGEVLELVHQIGPKEELSVEGLQPSEQEIGRFAMGIEQVFERFNHSCSSAGTLMSPRKSYQSIPSRIPRA